jgi:photosynthetic reaction center cytochrome c subunit
MRKAGLALAFLLISTSARAAQKNVQLLTGMTDLQLQQTMNFMRASLGVHCDFCHVVDDKDGWNFASDAKQTKRTARHMIQMVQEINEKNFDNNAAVACNTCHRGNIRPVSLPTLPQPAPPFPTPVRTRPTLPSRDDLVARYTAALGDISAYGLPRTLKGTREGWDQKSTPFDAQMSGGKWHIVSQTPDGRREQIVTAEGGWVKTNKDFEKMSDSNMEQFQMLANAFEPLSPLSIPKEVRILNTEKIGDRDTVIMTMRLDEKRRQRLFFDTSTGLLVRRQILTRVPVGEVPQQIDYDDYRDLGGVKFPFTIRVSLVDPWVSATRRYSEVHLGAKVDESVFTHPAGTQP